jgi:hypothetical protein
MVTNLPVLVSTVEHRNYKAFFMTLRTKLPLYLYQKYFSSKDALDSLFRRIEVIMDTRAIIYSIRILIILIAILMGYVHTPSNKNKDSNMNQTEMLDNKIDYKPILRLY